VACAPLVYYWPVFHRLALITALAFVTAPALHGSDGPRAQPSNPCDRTPTSPRTLVAAVHDATMTLKWKEPASGTPTEYLIEVGNAPGSTYLGTVPIGNTDLSFAKTVDPGIYYVRVRALNDCGRGPVSAEARVVVDPEHIGARTQPDVIVARRTAKRNTFFPAAELLRNGDVVVVYYDSPDHVSQAGRIAMVRSRDHGRTWSAPTVVIDGSRDERDPNIVETARGTWLVSYFQADAGRRPSSLGVFVIRSEDGGRTWSAPIEVGTTLDGAATSAKIVRLDDGDLLLPLYGASAGATGASATVVRSSDDGRTWSSDSETIIAAAMPGVSFVEPAVVSLGRGRLLAMIGSEGGEGAAHESYSLDNGRTWSPPARTALMAQASDLLAIVDGERTTVVHTWGDVSGRFGSSRPAVMQVTEFRDFPHARSTSEPRLLHQGHCWSDEGYPSSIPLAERLVFTVYYDACAGYIGGTVSSLDEPTAHANFSGAAPPPPF
jgi:hypothetical protein